MIDSDLKYFLAAIWRGRWRIVVGAALAVLVAVVANVTAQQVFVSEAKIMVIDPRANMVEDGEDTLARSMANERYARSLMEQGTSVDLIKKIVREVGGGRYGVLKLPESITVAIIRDTQVLSVQATGTSKSRAVRIATVATRELMREARLRAGSAGDAAAQDPAIGLKLVQTATTPRDSTGQPTSAVAGATLVVALFVLTGAQLIASRTSPKVYGRRDVADALPEAALVAETSLVDEAGNKSSLEYSRVLAAKLGAEMEASGTTTLAVAPVASTESAGRVASGLARAWALADRRSLLVDMDPSSQSWKSVSDSEPDRIALNALTDTDALQGLVSATRFANLKQIQVGSPSGDLEEALSSGQMRMLCAAASQSFDVVVINVRPMSASADAVLIAESGCGVLLTAEAGITGVAALKSCVDDLSQARCRLSGVVVTRG